MLSDTVVYWFDAYVSSKEEDKHQVFADLIGKPRKEAKELAYKIAYSVASSKIMAQYFKEGE